MTRRKLGATLAALALSLAAAAPVPALTPDPSRHPTKDSVLVRKDTSELLPVRGLTRVHVARPEVLGSIVISPDELLLIGILEGRTGLIVWDEGGRRELEVVVGEAATSGAEGALTLERGVAQVLDVDRVTRVAVANPGITEPVLVSPAEVLLNPGKAGSTTLWVWDATGRRSYTLEVR